MEHANKLESPENSQQFGRYRIFQSYKCPGPMIDSALQLPLNSMRIILPSTVGLPGCSFAITLYLLTEIKFQLKLKSSCGGGRLL
jgi:hypothetical protein